ncbi:MAG: Fe-S cluster assembly protein SufD [Ignavibacteriae bacterium]|nr:Fe-S cluster assembly protein SufD [Ignavibacteriota bacterium]
MNKEKNIKNWYLENFQKFDKVNNDNFKKLRADAANDFEKSEFPTKKNEEWKYTNISPILNNEFFPSPLVKQDFENISIDQYKIQNLDTHLVVFINGIFNKELSELNDIENNVIIDSFFSQSTLNHELISKYSSKLESGLNSFTLLNHTFTYDGCFIYIPKNKIVEKPIHILNISIDNPNKQLIQPRNLIIAEANTQANIIYDFVGKDGLEYFTNTITDISVGENANLSFIKIQNESNLAFHIDKTDIHQNNSSILNHFSLSFGSKIARNDINTKLDGENIECHLFGLYLGNDEQHIDNHTFINHAKPNCMSNELYKGILDDKAKGVFSGKILVDRIAQKTNAFQSNKSVLLSNEASIDAKPQLEIYADDVKCSHGATVGKLDEQAYFYIRSRGVSAEAARSMLIRAFIDDVVSEIKIEQLKDKVNHIIFEHLHREAF